MTATAHNTTASCRLRRIVVGLGSAAVALRLCRSIAAASAVVDLRGILVLALALILVTIILLAIVLVTVIITIHGLLGTLFAAVVTEVETRMISLVRRTVDVMGFGFNLVVISVALAIEST